MAKKKRPWQQRELRLTAEYLEKFHPNATVMTRVRLGSIHPAFKPEIMTQVTRKMFIQFNRWADAIAIEPDRLVLIECMIPPRPQKVAQLELYETLIPTTPELVEYLDRPIEKVLVMAVDDPALRSWAMGKGVKVVVFTPDWVGPYLAERSKRYGSQSRAGS